MKRLALNLPCESCGSLQNFYKSKVCKKCNTYNKIPLRAWIGIYAGVFFASLAISSFVFAFKEDAVRNIVDGIIYGFWSLVNFVFMHLINRVYFLGRHMEKTIEDLHKIIRAKNLIKSYEDSNNTIASNN